MDIRWLQDFLTLAETGNFTRAAESRHSSQAAFSRRIQALEASLGVTLIDRGVFPTCLTPEGERFKSHAGAIMRQIVDARIDLSGEPLQRGRDPVRIALPHALATGRLAGWWPEWSAELAIACTVLPGNVHDTVTSFVAGNADLLICFHHAQQPIHLDPDRFERVVVGRERLRPYASPALMNRMRIALPGSEGAPLPLLMYSPGAYLGRMVELILESAPEPLMGVRLVESDMADALHAMARAGCGIAWLPDCAVAGSLPDHLVALDGAGGAWTLDLAIIAYRDRANTRAVINRLWDRLAAGPAGKPAAPVPRSLPHSPRAVRGNAAAD